MIITSQGTCSFQKLWRLDLSIVLEGYKNKLLQMNCRNSTVFSCVPCCMNFYHIAYCVLSTVYCFMHFVVVKSMGHGSCIIGHGSVFVWVCCLFWGRDRVTVRWHRHILYMGGDMLLCVCLTVTILRHYRRRYTVYCHSSALN